MMKEPTDHVTILTVAQPGAHACKIRRPGNILEPYNAGHWFRASEVIVSSVHELSELLSDLEHQPSSLIIRGRLRPDHDGVAVAENSDAQARAALVAFGGRTVEITKNLTLRRNDLFESVAHNWVCIDIDDLPVPDGMCAVSIEAVQYAVNLLGSEFEGVKFHYQFSSSARPDSPLVKIHLWFWLTQPVTDEELKRWADLPRGVRIDSALYQKVQQHYTAAPLCLSGAVDPLLGKRSGFCS